MKKLFKEEFERSWELILSDVPFCHARYADGEICLMKGLEVSEGSQATNVDKWSAPPTLTKMGKCLKETLNHTESNYFYAISCDTSNTDDKNYLLQNIPQDRKFITFANLWINGNYDTFVERLNSLKKDVIIIGNESGVSGKYPFHVENYMSFGNDCVNMWESSSEEIKNILTESFRDVRGKTFFISVGPMSELIIHHLWEVNPHNQYIDVGSAIDEFVHGRKTRPYMVPGNIYNKQICEMEV